MKNMSKLKRKDLKEKNQKEIQILKEYYRIDQITIYDIINNNSL